jgi:exo-beta-1,3-glucanase (GH17 family)
MKLGILANIIILCGILGDSVVGHPFRKYTACTASGASNSTSFIDARKKRAMKTEVVFVTETVAHAVVYVDQDGIPYSTSTAVLASNNSVVVTGPAPVLFNSGTLAPTEPAPTPSVSLSVTPALVQLAPSSSVAAPSLTTPAATYISSPPPPPPSKAPEPKTSLTSPISIPSAKAPEPQTVVNTELVTESEDSFPLGITYDPFKGVPGQCQCKTSGEMAAEFEKMKDFGIMRIYGDDCGVIPVAVQQAKKNNQLLMAGIYTPNQVIGTVVKALSDAIRQYNDGNWDIIGLVSVENERVNAHVITVANAQDSVTQAREALKDAGYTGPVGVVETVPAVIDNPSLCDRSEMTLVNIHAFFDPNTGAEDSGEFVKSEVVRVQKACPGKRVIVTESGWPSQGTSHNKAVASKDAQKAAIKSIRAAFSNDLFLFNAFDSPWKTDDPSTFNSERYWGIL